MRRLSRLKEGRSWRPSPALVLALAALVVALGGTAQALPGANVVDNNDLRNNVVGTRNIKPEAVRGLDIRSDAVGASEIAPDAVQESEIGAGAVQDGELGTIVVRKATTAIPDGASGRAEASCLPGERIIGGGGDTQQSAFDAIFHGSHPSVGGGLAPVVGNTFTSWNAKATNVAGNLATVDVNAWALCLQ
jgi:hypothetical protein